MRRLSRPREPLEFTQGTGAFKAANPWGVHATEGKRWDAFRNEQQAADQAARESLRANQQSLCAYCEILLEGTNQQIEHFVPKLCSQAQQDWTLDFSNFFLCCIGGTNTYSPRSGEYSAHPSAKANFSCGAKKGDADPHGVLLNPYALPEVPIFSTTYHPDQPDKGGLLCLVVDKEVCRRESIDPDKAQHTLDMLGLNCPRLMRNRGEVWRSMVAELEELEEEIASLPMNEQAQVIETCAKEHLTPQDDKLPAYVTTRFLCLADYLAVPRLLEIARGSLCPTP